MNIVGTHFAAQAQGVWDLCPDDSKVMGPNDSKVRTDRFNLKIIVLGSVRGGQGISSISYYLHLSSLPFMCRFRLVVLILVSSTPP